MLPVDYSRSHRRPSLHFFQENGLLQREIDKGGFPSRRHDPSSLQSVGSFVQDQESEPESEHEETVTEVHGSSHGRWFRILVHGVLKLQESFQLP